jgi:hypothetical protein
LHIPKLSLQIGICRIYGKKSTLQRVQVDDKYNRTFFLK